MGILLNILFLGLALIVIPLAYIALCLRMKSHNTPRLCYAAYFVLFGTVGGWCLALGLSPSGLTAMCIVFLATVAPLACLVSSLTLQFGPIRTQFEEIAIIGGYSYIGLLIVWFIAILIWSLIFS